MSVDALKRKIESISSNVKTMEDNLKRANRERDALRIKLQESEDRFKLTVFGDGPGKPGLYGELAAAQKRIKELENLKGTPANNHPEGEDPFANYLDRERADLTLGDYTDDQLANAVFMYGNEAPDMNLVILHKALMPLVYLTAAKERIRWLSRKLLEATQKNPSST